MASCKKMLVETKHTEKTLHGKIAARKWMIVDANRLLRDTLDIGNMCCSVESQMLPKIMFYV